MLESEDKMRRQIEQKERMLRAEREEKETTMAMLRAKQDELDRYVSRKSLFSTYLLTKILFYATQENMS